MNYIKTNGKKIGFRVTENLPKPTNILSRITDTGGCNDEKRDISKFKNPGQFVRVIGTIKLIPIEQFTSPDGKFVYHTFFGSVEHEFIPNLNNEHLGYSWVDSGYIPKPLHPGLWSTINIDEIQSKIKIIELDINN